MPTRVAESRSRIPPTGIASARASGAFVLVVPSLPGADHDGDFIVASLADPAVLDWGEVSHLGYSARLNLSECGFWRR